MKRCPHCGRPLEPDAELFPDRVRGMVRREHPDTSRQAAMRVARTLSETKVKVIRCFGNNGPMTDREMDSHATASYGERPESSYRKRRSELTEEGLIETTGRTRTEAGSPRLVWQLSARGRAVFATLMEGTTSHDV